MRLKSTTALAALTLMLGSTLAFARTPQQGPPPDPSQQQGGRPDRGGPDGPGPNGRRGFMRGGGPQGGEDGRREWMERDGDGKGRWGRGGPMGMRRGPMGMRGGRMGMRGGPMGMRGGMGEGAREFGLARLLSNPEVRQQIGVSAEQVAKIRQQESDFRKAEIRNRADLQVKRLDLQDLLSAEKPDRAAIDSKLQEISAAQLAMEKSGIDFHLNMRDAITPAQRQKLEQWMRQRREPGRGENASPRGLRGEGQGGRAGRGGSGSAAPPAPNSQAQPAH